MKTKKLIASILVFAFIGGRCNGLTLARDFEPYKFDSKSGDVTVTQSADGTKGIFTINNCNASKLFSFKFNLNPGESLVTARDYLGEEFDTGEAFVVDENNVIKKIIDKPWAIDAKGNKIPTHFNATANILTQTVDYSCNDSFPITADPNAWQITMCIAQISTVLLSAALPIAKIVQIKRAIQIAGGLSIFAQLLIGLIMGTANAATILTAFGPVVLNALLILTGIGGIIEKCKW